MRVIQKLILLVMCGFVLMAPTISTAETFKQFVVEIKNLAIKKGISKKTVTRVLGKVKLVDFLAVQKKAPRGPVIYNFEQYLAATVNPKRIHNCLARIKKHRVVLNRIANKYQIPTEYIVAIWGLETDFGRLQGDYPEIDTLATLAYRSHRRGLFKYELMAALKIIDKGIIGLERMRGSWAGAMGQCQFMPSTYLAYAIDYAAKGRRDIWHDVSDVMASTANYLRSLHFNNQHGVVIEVRLPSYFPQYWQGMNIKRGMHYWDTLGVRDLQGGHLPAGNEPASIILPMGKTSPAYLVYADNFKTIYRWNHSVFYALSVGILANRILESLDDVDDLA